MKYIRTVFYVLKQGAKNIVKNLFMVFAAIIVVFSVLLLLGGMISISKNIQTIIEQYSSKTEVQVNLHSYVKQDQAEKLVEIIKKDSRVETVQLITADETFANLMEYFKGDEDLFEDYKDSEYLHYISLNIDLVQYADGTGFCNEIVKFDEVDNVKDIVSTISKMEAAQFWVRIGTILLIIGTAVLSILLIFNTVKLTVYARSREIEIMRYVGASTWYICGPFVIEGVFTGLLGGVAAFFALKAIYNAAISGIARSLLGTTVKLYNFEEMGIDFLIIFIVAGIVAGVIASLWAIRKHVRV